MPSRKNGIDQASSLFIRWAAPYGRAEVAQRGRIVPIVAGISGEGSIQCAKGTDSACFVRCHSRTKQVRRRNGKQKHKSGQGAKTNEPRSQRTTVVYLSLSVARKGFIDLVGDGMFQLGVNRGN